MSNDVPVSCECRSPLGSMTNVSPVDSTERLPLDDRFYNAQVCYSKDSVWSMSGRGQSRSSVRRILSDPGTMQGDAAPMSIHYPTLLDSIAEVPSNANLKAGRTGKQKAGEGRQRSFSVDDLKTFGRRLWKSKSSCSSEPLSCLPTACEYPKRPHAPPPERLPTPPNLPRFNTAEAANYSLAPPPLTIRDYVPLLPSAYDEWVRQTAFLPRGAVMRGDDGTIVRGTWRAMPSGHTGSSRRAFTPHANPFDSNEAVQAPGPALDRHAVLPDLEAGERRRRRRTRRTRRQKGVWFHCCERILFCCEHDDHDEREGVGAVPVRIWRTL